MAKASTAESRAPLTSTWKNARMIRNHSLRACVNEILNLNEDRDVVRINLIGDSGTGKTTLAKSMAHIIHQEADSPFVVKVFSRAELLDMENTVSNFEPINHVLIFDDVSWLVSGNNKSKIDQVQKTFTEIRHLKGGQNIKVIIFFCFHYNMSIPKHLRQANFFAYTTIGTSEMENTQKLVGTKYTSKIIEFQKVAFEAGTTRQKKTETADEIPATFSYKLGKFNKFTYVYRKPFAPALWWNTNSLRHIVFPAREWIDPVCTICSGSMVKSEEERGDVLKFKEIADKTYGESRIRNALRIILYQRGINTFAPEIKRAVNWVEREWQVKVYDFEEIMKLYDLDATATHSRTPSIEKQEKKKLDSLNTVAEAHPDSTP